MADPGRLDELKRRFDENPKRYFAPLANEYRKAGEAELAIELCRTYLPQQPTHMSGYIVYGQALHDAGRSDEAAAVFRQALTLDPENIIALRHLGDIARDAGDQDDAASWYEKVLELDPRNEEISAFLGSRATPDAGRAPRSGPEREPPPTVRPEPEHDESAVRLEDIVSEPDSAQAPMVTEITRKTEIVYESGAAQTGPVWEDEFQETAGTASELEYGAADDAPAEERHPARDVSVEAAQWPSARDTAESLGADAPESADAIEGPWHSGAAAMEPGVANDASFGETPAIGSPFVTETMAELYMQQGLHGEALTIYRQLALSRNDPRLHQRVSELEGAQGSPAHAENVREFFSRIGHARAHERVQLAAEPSSLSALFAGTAPESADVAAAQRLSGAYGSPRPGSPNS